MPQKTIYMYVFDTLSDWEPGYALAELQSGRYFKKGAPRFRTKTFGLTREPVRTMGGVCLVPDLTIDELKPEEAGLLLLPGGDDLLEPRHAPVWQKAGAFLRTGMPVAAICGATAALAQAGLLDDKAHTSIDLGYLQGVCPAYKGAAHYRQEPAVTDGNLITANGTAPLEFAYHILRHLDVFSPATLAAWYDLFRTHEARCFQELMVALAEGADAAG